MTRLRSTLRAIDLSDVLTVLSLGCLSVGVAMLSVPLALIILGGALALMTPLPGAVRFLIRGR